MAQTQYAIIAQDTDQLDEEDRCLLENLDYEENIFEQSGVEAAQIIKGFATSPAFDAENIPTRWLQGIRRLTEVTRYKLSLAEDCIRRAIEERTIGHDQVLMVFEDLEEARDHAMRCLETASIVETLATQPGHPGSYPFLSRYTEISHDLAQATRIIMGIVALPVFGTNPMPATWLRAVKRLADIVGLDVGLARGCIQRAVRERTHKDDLTLISLDDLDKARDDAIRRLVTNAVVETLTARPEHPRYWAYLMELDETPYEIPPIQRARDEDGPTYEEYESSRLFFERLR